MGKPDNPYQTGSTKYLLYELLINRENVTTMEIYRGLKIRRIATIMKDIRAYLAARGCKLVATKTGRFNRDWLYKIIENKHLVRS